MYDFNFVISSRSEGNVPVPENSIQISESRSRTINEKESIWKLNYERSDFNEGLTTIVNKGQNFNFAPPINVADESQIPGTSGNNPLPHSKI